MAYQDDNGVSSDGIALSRSDWRQIIFLQPAFILGKFNLEKSP